MRRITTVLFIFIAVCLSLTMGAAGTAFAETDTGYSGDLSAYGAVLLIDADSGFVLESHNADEQIEPASTTKIMTCILALENAKLDDDVTISAKAAGTSGQSLDLAENETVKMGDLLNAMMMYSGNDAAVAVAEHVGGGDVATFVDMMNAKAQALGMSSTHFVNPNGLHDDGHLSTAADLAKLTQYAMKNSDFVNIVKQESFTMPQSDKRMEKTYENTNHLVLPDDPDYYASATGVKTGSTTAAGACLVATATKDGMNLICLIFKDESEDGKNRWSLAKSLFDYGFDSYTTVDIQTLLDKAPPVQIQVENYASTDESDGLLTFEGPSSPGVFATLKKATVSGVLDGTDTIEAVPTYDAANLMAPILKGETLGTVTYKSTATGEELYTGPLIASRDVAEVGAEPDASGGTAVSVMPAVSMEDLSKHDGDIFYWLIPPGILIAVLVWRLVTVQRRKRKRFSKKRPHYSYRIK